MFAMFATVLVLPRLVVSSVLATDNANDFFPTMDRNSAADSQKLQHIQEQVVQALTGGAHSSGIGSSPGILEFLRSVEGLINGMKGPILAAHTWSGKLLAEHVDAFGECVSEFDDANAHIATQGDLARVYSGGHIHCRTQQAGHVAEINACEEVRQHKCDMATAACGLVNKTFPTCPPQADGLSDLAFLEDIKAFIHGEMTAENERKAMCTNHTSICEAHVCLEDHYAGVCADKQHELEAASCAVSQVIAAQCLAYQHCHGQAVAKFNKAATLAEQEAKHRKQEYRLIMTIDCLIGSRLNDESAELDQQLITDCKNQQVNTSMFRIDVPLHPALQNCTTLRAELIAAAIRRELREKSQDAADAIADATLSAYMAAGADSIEGRSQHAADALAQATKDAYSSAASVGGAASSILQTRSPNVPGSGTATAASTGPVFASPEGGGGSAHNDSADALAKANEAAENLAAAASAAAAGGTGGPRAPWHEYRPCTAEYVQAEYVAPFEAIENFAALVPLTCQSDCVLPTRHMPSAKEMASKAADAIARATEKAFQAANSSALARHSQAAADAIATATQEAYQASVDSAALHSQASNAAEALAGAQEDAAAMTQDPTAAPTAAAQIIQSAPEAGNGGPPPGASFG